VSLDPRRLARHLRESYRAGTTPTRFGPFTCYLHPGSDHEALNVAVPDDPVEGRIVPVEGADAPREDDVPLALASMRAHFLANRRRPRIEFLLEQHPGLSATLGRLGWSEEVRLPVLACTRETWRGMAATASLRVEALLPTTPWPVARDYLLVQREAYGLEMPIPERAPPGYWESLQIGAGVLARVDGIPVAAGGLTPQLEGLCDVRGLGVKPAFRRRGVGSFLLSALARIAHETGADAVVAIPDGRESLALAKKAGFEPAAMLVSFRAADAAAP
jgi:GNAT superfamily N-acetyltransferase